MEKPEKAASEHLRKGLSEVWTEAIARYLNAVEGHRYRTLREKSSLLETEEKELRALARKTDDINSFSDRAQINDTYLQALDEKLQNDPDNPEVQRAWLREMTAMCYPNYGEVLAEMFARDEYTIPVYPPARQGLEGVLHVMDYTTVAHVLLDPDQRVTFLSNLTAMLEPFRQLKARMSEQEKLPDLNKAFAFRTQGQGYGTSEKKLITMGGWDVPCLDLHLLHLAEVKITQAWARVAKVHNKSEDALRHAYEAWSSRSARKEWLRRGDDFAQKFLAVPQCQALLETAYPV